MKKVSVTESVEAIIPVQMWFSLKEACELKSLNYKTACNKRYLQPLRGIPEGRIGGKKKWLRPTIIEWIVQSDEIIGGENE